MAFRQLTRRHARLLLVCLGLLAALLPVRDAAGAESKPYVSVSFQVAVPEFQRNLPQLAQAEVVIARALAAMFADSYAFADWSAGGPRTGTQLGTLILKLEKDESTRPGPKVFVRFYGAVPGGTLRATKIPEIEIYAPSFLNWDTNNRAAFEARLLGNAAPIVRTPAFQAEFFQHFLALLPIASTVLPRATERVIDIPVQWTQNLLAPESILTVRFGKSVQQTKLEGSMTLTNITAHVEAAPAAGGAAAPARLRGSVTAATFDAKPLLLDASRWNKRLPELLSGAKAYCFIAVYKGRDSLLPEDTTLLGLP